MDKRIRVVQMFYTFDIEAGGGGLSRFAIDLGQNLDRSLFEVVFCSLGYYDTPLGQKRIRELNEEGYLAFEATRWDQDKPYQSFLAAQRSLQKRFSAQPVDILHSHSEYTDINAMLLKILLRSPAILRTVHYGYRYEWSTKPLRRHILTNFLYPILFNQEIGINQFNTNRLNHRYVARLLGKRAKRIYNAIPLERFDNIQVNIVEKKCSLGIPAESPVIGSVGRLAEQKGYTYFLDAAAQVIDEIKQAYFLIVGDGPLADELRAKTIDLNIADRVIFTGSRTDVGELLHCMDLFVSSSLWEGLPTVILEAMACGIPVVATDIPGTTELVHDGVNGRIIPPMNGEHLKKVILEMVKSLSTTSKEMAMRAKATVKLFNIKKIANQYEQIYPALKAK
jgi:glycosyltransferase involved in cell wall biosynthesis